MTHSEALLWSLMSTKPVLVDGEDKACYLDGWLMPKAFAFTLCSYHYMGTPITPKMKLELFALVTDLLENNNLGHVIKYYDAARYWSASSAKMSPKLKLNTDWIEDPMEMVKYFYMNQ